MLIFSYFDTGESYFKISLKDINSSSCRKIRMVHNLGKCFSFLSILPQYFSNSIAINLAISLKIKKFHDINFLVVFHSQHIIYQALITGPNETKNIFQKSENWLASQPPPDCPMMGYSRKNANMGEGVRIGTFFLEQLKYLSIFSWR